MLKTQSKKEKSGEIVKKNAQCKHQAFANLNKCAINHIFKMIQLFDWKYYVLRFLLY